MAEGIEALGHQLGTAGKLKGVVRTMKALAAANIAEYENAVRSLEGYYQTVRLGLVACFTDGGLPTEDGGKLPAEDGRKLPAGDGRNS